MIDVVPKTLHQIIAQIHKVGTPRDSLIAYVYKVDKDEAAWVPAAKKFFSRPLAAQKISSQGPGLAIFHFDESIELKRGRHFFIIYRTGHPDDHNYYTLHKSHLAVQ